MRDDPANYNTEQMPAKIQLLGHALEAIPTRRDRKE
jgi:hypothetical protein